MTGRSGWGAAAGAASAERRWLQLDRAIEYATAEWRQACHGLRSATAPVPNPLDLPWCGADTYRRLRRQQPSDALLTQLAAWTYALIVERWCWRARRNEAAAWLLAVPGSAGGAARDDGLRIRDLRQGLLFDATADGRAEYAAVLIHNAGPVAAAAAGLHRQRAAAEAELDAGAGPPRPQLAIVAQPDLAAVAARALLCRTDDCAADLRAPTWWEGLRAAIGVSADRGWPARLRGHWLSEVFHQSSLTAGLRLPAAGPRTLRGALSFARALGDFGVAVLDAGRRERDPFVLHLHPFGLRRQQRFGLFASIVAERSFARRVLGLGRRMAHDQSRQVAQAMLHSLRIEALGVLAGALWRAGHQEARQHFSELSRRALGRPLPPELLGVIPTLRPYDGYRLLGRLQAAAQRASLIEVYDEDWFRNPRAVAQLRLEDTLNEQLSPFDEAAARGAADAAGDALEAALS